MPIYTFKSWGTHWVDTLLAQRPLHYERNARMLKERNWFFCVAILQRYFVSIVYIYVKRKVKSQRS